MAAKKRLFTIGYEQTPAKAVLDELEQAGVKLKLLVDVRAVTSSRRPGFSKNQLAAGLDERGIAYLHLRGLGTPKEGRLAARSVAASATTIGSEYSARAAAGWRFLDRFWAGPEVANTGLAPLTAFKTGTLEWSVGSGFVEDSFHRSGIYGRIGVLTRQ